ncbi:hypothetical protein [Cognaticolwellia aestuarii]|uniref:hypothetical protein n=1 Tax=Cognaticolwellia aestuarii TaxID=329993 RepID=UPI0011774D44|nr:hypothetical protein [Cognaticolwellia aestuarii]
MSVYDGTYSLLALMFLVITSVSNAQAIEFTTEHNTESEKMTIELIKSLNKAHDLTKWQFSNVIHINKKAIPHSHPVLTLHTRHNKPKEIDLLLSTYLHENIHGYLDAHQTKLADIIAVLKKRFPNVAVGYPEGASDEYSTYLHIVVCFLELDAIRQLLSEARYNKVINFWQKDHYTWIYKLIDEHDNEIAMLIKQHKLLL